MTAHRSAITGAMLVVILTGACTVPSDPAGASRQAEFERDKKVRYDLSTQPRDAQQLGVKPGTTTGAFNRDGDGYWTYEIALPGGRLFRTQGFGHRVIVQPGPKQFPYDSVLINSKVKDIDAAEQELLAAAPVLGLDTTRITSWADKARATPLTTVNSLDTLGFTGTHLDYLTPDVEVRRSEGVDHLVINWDFLWNRFTDMQSAAPTAPPKPARTP